MSLRWKGAVDDATLARTLWWKAWSWESENKVPVVAKPSLSMKGGPPRLNIKLAPVPTFSFAAYLADWAPRFTGDSCEVISDGLGCFRAVAEVVASIHACGRKRFVIPMNYQYCRWINTVLQQLKTSFSGSFHALRLSKVR